MCHIYITHFQEPEKLKHTAEHQVGLSLLSKALEDLYEICIPASEIEAHLETNPYGKPHLKGYPDIHFNISHSRQTAVCAVSSDVIGADVEEIREYFPPVLRKVFTEEERTFFERMSVSEDAAQEWFFRFWTLKESRIKFAGMGLAMALTDFSFSFDTTTDPYRITCSDPGLFFHQKILEDNYVLSLCSGSVLNQISITWI